jgi:uncharacterized membrane protein YphA (DoxX/SURF4 family)
MKKNPVSKVLSLVLRLALGGVFIYAGALKLLDPDAFAQAIDAYGLVNWGTAKILARALPVIEVASGAGLILGIRGALGLVVAQLLVFLAVTAYALHMGLDVDCGCFGPAAGSPAASIFGSSGSSAVDELAAGSGSLVQTLVRDTLMLIACLIIHRQQKGARGADR